MRRKKQPEAQQTNTRNMPAARPNKRLATTNTRMTRKERELQELEKMISQEEKSIKTPYKQTGISKSGVNKSKTKAPPKPSPKLKREKSSINKIYDYEDDFDDDFDDEKAASGYGDDFDDESDENSGNGMNFDKTAVGPEEPSRSDSRSENFDVVSKRSSSNMSETMLAPVKRESDSSIPKLNRETTRMRHLKPLVQLTRSQYFELLNLSDNNIQQSTSQTSFQSLQLNSASQQTQTSKNAVSNSTQSEDIPVRTVYTDTDTNDTGWEADKHDANVFKLNHGKNDKNDENYTKKMEIFHSPEFKQSVTASSRLMFSVLQDIQARQMINRTKKF